MKLQGKIAVVTGAARGIGRAICERYVVEGAFVFVTDVDEAKAQAVAASLGAQAAALKLDVTSQDFDRCDDRGGGRAAGTAGHPGQQCRDIRPRPDRRDHA